MARLARTSAARNSSISPARALRRPIRIVCPSGAAATSRPALRASRIIGLLSGLCSQRAPRSNGTPKVERSVMQRPPISLAASTTITLRLAAIIRRAAAMPATPAPITTISASRGGTAAPKAPRDEEPGLPQAPRRRKESRAASWSCHGFRKLRNEGNGQRTLPHLKAVRQLSW